VEEKRATKKQKLMKLVGFFYERQFDFFQSLSKISKRLVNS